MKIWVTVNENGYLDSYSKTKQENQQVVEVEGELKDFTNWRLEGTNLIYDPDGAPLVEEGLTETDQLKQQNAMMAKQLATSSLQQNQMQQMMAKMMKQIAELESGGNANV